MPAKGLGSRGGFSGTSELSGAALESQDGSENQLREKATAVLSAASIVVPVAAVALGSAPAGAVIPFFPGSRV
jgi:hypothetical protein